MIMCVPQCTSRKTQVAMLYVFFGLLNIPIVDAFMLYKELGIVTSRKEKLRRLFMHKMAYELTKPLGAQSAERLIKGSLLQTVKVCLDLKEPLPPVQPASGRRAANSATGRPPAGVGVCVLIAAGQCACITTNSCGQTACSKRRMNMFYVGKM